MVEPQRKRHKENNDYDDESSNRLDPSPSPESALVGVASTNKVDRRIHILTVGDGRWLGFLLFLINLHYFYTSNYERSVRGDISGLRRLIELLVYN